MAVMGKVATVWAGTSGGPGITQLYVANTVLGNLTAGEAQTAVNAVRSFWDVVKPYLPDEVTLTVQPTVDQYQDTDGELVNSVTAATPPASVVGTSASAFLMPSGVKVNLQTSTIRNGRRVRGAIYIVPATLAAMTTAGAVAGAARTAINSAGASLISTLAAANMNLLVWSRPLKDAGGTVVRNGAWTAVQSMETNEKAAVLRGRRD